MEQNRTRILVAAIGVLTAIIGAAAVIIAALIESGFVSRPEPTVETPSYVLTDLTFSTIPRTIQLFDINNRDFTAETHLLFSPQRDFEAAGIYVELEQDGRIEFVFAHCSTNTAGCVGQGIYLDVLNSFSLEPSEHPVGESVPYIGTEVFLRLEKISDEYSAKFRRAPSDTWMAVGTFRTDQNVLRVGLVAQPSWPRSRDDRDNNPNNLTILRARFAEFTLRFSR